MESSVNEISSVLVEVKVEVPWDVVQKDLESNFKKLTRTARIKGFRPGKAPAKIIRKLYSKQVKAEVAGALIEKGLLNAVEKHELHVVAQPEVEEPTITDGEAMTFTAKIEVRPKVSSVDFKGLELYRSSTEIEESAIDEEVERLREMNAEIQVPDPMRPAKAGDQLLFSYEVSIDGEAKPEMASENRPAELGTGNLLPEFEEGLLGLSPGEEKEIEVEFGDDNPNEELKGKKAVFQIKLAELKEKLLPDLDDEFAKDCGEYETLTELRAKTRENLEQTATQRAEMEMKDQVVDRLVDKNEIEVPPSMVKEQQQQMFYEFAQFMQMSGGGGGLSPDMFEGMEDRARRRVRAGILLGALARQEKVEVNDDDVDAKLGAIAEETGKNVAKVKVEYKGEKREQLESQLLEQKLMDILLEAATIKDGPAPDAEKQEEKEDE